MVSMSPLITNQYNYDIRSYRFCPYTHEKQLIKTIPQYGELVEANDTENPAEHLLLSVPGIGNICFIHLGQEIIPGYEGCIEGEYAAFIRFKEKEVYIRYDSINAATLQLDNTDPNQKIWTPHCTVTPLGTLFLNDLYHHAKRGPSRKVDALLSNKRTSTLERNVFS